MAPQPRRRPAQAPPPADTGAAQGGTSAAAAAATAAALAAVAGTGGGPSAAATAAATAAAQALGGLSAAAVPTPTAVSAATATLITAMDQLFRQRRKTLMQALSNQVMGEMPGARADRVEELARREMAFEVEFQRKARLRLEKDLPEALKLADPSARAAAVGKIMEREKRYLAQREQASVGRMVAALEMDLLRPLSPLGAYWELSPLVREHCPKCLAMAGKFWPWEVLDMPGMHLPQHPNCGCRLLSLDEAVGKGLMSADQIPDTEDAIKRAQDLIQEAERLERVLHPETLARVVQEMESDRIQEAFHRQQLRFEKGFQKGGEFAPRGGGNPGSTIVGKVKHDLESLRKLVHAESPAQKAKAGRGRKVTLRGSDQHVPEAEHWNARIGGVAYQSPAGGTHLYREGILMGSDHPDFGPGPYPAGPPPLAGVPVGDRWREGGEVGTAKPPVQGIPDYTGQKLVVGKAAGGSNGAVWATDPQGDKWLVKTYRGDQDRIATELLSNAIYREMGARVPEAGTWGAPGLPDFTQIPDADVGEPDLPKGGTTASGAKKPGPRISTGMIVREPDGRMWIYEPKGHFGGYEHTFPKGGLEKGLTPQQNAHKELWEETGLHAAVVGHVGDYQGDTGLTRYYLAVRTGGEPHPDDPSPYDGGNETAAVKLVTPDEAKTMLNRSRDQKVLEDATAMDVPTTVPPDNFPPAADVAALTYMALPGETQKIEAPNTALGDHYMTDALLANWDFIGATHDNVLWQGDTPIRLDQGGTLQYRAMGQQKPFGGVPSEVWTMLSPKGGQGFGTVAVNEARMRDQASEIARRLPPEQIDKLVDQAPFKDTEMREQVRQALKERVGWMARYADGEESLPQPLEGNTARAAFTNWQSEFEPYPEQHAALTDFLTDDALRGDVQASLRSGSSKDATEGMKNTVKNLDSLLRQNRTDDDVTVYLPWGSKLDSAHLVGQTVKDKGYLMATTSRGDARNADDKVIQLMIPSGSRALYTPQVDGIDDAVGGLGVRAEMPGAEVLLPRGSRLKVVGTTKEGGHDVIQAVLVP